MLLVRKTLVLLTLIAAFLRCGSAAPRPFLADSRQVIVVLTDGEHVTSGTLQRYQRVGEGRWQAVGDAVPVVVGRNGLAPIDQKKEGDGRSPSGVFTLSTAFGFDDPNDLRLPFLTLRPTTECVDDSSSRYYNEIVDRDEARVVDWKSSEKMATIDQYRLGVQVDYNRPAQPRRGSCIFLHIWNGPSSTTSGCTAMKREDLDTLLHWLDPLASPRLVQFMRNDYARMAGLP